MQYGEKYRAILKLKKIYELKDYIKHHSSDDKAKVLLVSLVYSLTAHSPRYKVSLEEKLISLNLDQGLLKELPLFKERADSLCPLNGSPCDEAQLARS